MTLLFKKIHNTFSLRNHLFFYRLAFAICIIIMRFSLKADASPRTPLIDNLDRSYTITAGLQGRNIALWHSHGLYYDQRDDRWKWQRARVMTVVEDKYTMSYVLPYLLPMLERAGATVFMPRERDTQPNEYIVDNDTSAFTSGHYIEEAYPYPDNRHRLMTTGFTSGGHAGFGLKRKQYIDRQNPFAEGTFRRRHTSNRPTVQVCWQPEIKASGWYWVSVAYAADRHAVPDAHYTVHHAAGTTHFHVDQRRGAGTWIYLGQFYFEAGADRRHASVTLDNSSSHNGVITADAVRWGGGMGCIGRRPASDDEIALYKGTEISKRDKIQCYKKNEYTTSHRLRLWEASRYYLQWAGAPYHVYSESQSMNDYRDDYNCRPLWVNWLSYGSPQAPDSTGLGIGIDAALAFHSDAGTAVDSIIGTMGIYTTRGDGRTKVYPNGKKRDLAGLLTESVVNQVIADIRATHCRKWTDRLCHDLNYAETRRANVPTMILELLSHQNYDDMRYGLDPNFRFTVSRAVYKGITRFIAAQHGYDCVIAPLPIRDFSIEYTDHPDSILISWRPQADTLEPTAVAERYILYTSADGRGWDNGTCITTTRCMAPIASGKPMRYKVTAVNAGGESMDSPVLTAYRSPHSRGRVMIVDAFDRTAAPQGFAAGDYAGFPSWTDHGVPHDRDLLFVGRQHDFDRRNPWLTDDHAGWGQSDSDFDFRPPVGNDGSHLLINARATAAAGYSYVTATHQATARLTLHHDRYDVINVVLGEQRATAIGPDSAQTAYTTIDTTLRHAITRYTATGGNLLISGAYIASDAWHGRNASDSYRLFIQNTLRIKWRTDRASQDGRIEAAAMPTPILHGNWTFSTTLNDSIYEVESPDAILPSHPDAIPALIYSQNSTIAAVACSADGYKSIACGFPLETITDSSSLNELMRQMLTYLNN